MGIILVTRITSEHSDISKVLTNCTGIILVTHATKQQAIEIKHILTARVSI